MLIQLEDKMLSLQEINIPYLEMPQSTLKVMGMQLKNRGRKGEF